MRGRLSANANNRTRLVPAMTEHARMLNTIDLSSISHVSTVVNLHITSETARVNMNVNTRIPRLKRSDAARFLRAHSRMVHSNRPRTTGNACTTTWGADVITVVEWDVGTRRPSSPVSLQFMIGLIYVKKSPDAMRKCIMEQLFPLGGEDAHVSICAQEITAFMDVDSVNQICFRCGETGHVRFQCLTFRVRLCTKFQNGECNDRNCTFAHGPSNIRSPWKARCVRVIKQGGNLVCIGCNSENHTFRRCPLNKDLMIL